MLKTKILTNLFILIVFAASFLGFYVVSSLSL
jgi:hypothetical protein